jgi:hypothetical protein
MPTSRLMRHRRALAPLLAAAVTALAITACGSSGVSGPPTTIALADTASAAVNPVTVSPFPGTPDASPTTQISFLGGPGTRVSGVKVVGSHSGSHTGKLEAYSTGTGESFIPSHAFTPGEKVTVSARVSQGTTHTSTVHTSFSIGFMVPSSQDQFPTHPGNTTEVQHYLSAPAIAPSSVRITTPAAAGATPGDFFLAPYQGAGTPGNMIVDPAGNLVWFHPLPPNDSSTNFRVQQYQGKPVLTWWQGRILKLGFGQGEDEIYDTSYRPVARVRAGNGLSADLHEFLLSSQGTAWIDCFDPVTLDLTSMGGLAKEVVNDSVVQEVDVKTGLVMWEWHAMGHVPLRDSYSPIPHTTNWDYIHVNSVAPGPNGQVLLSARNTWTVYDVNLHTGGFIWRIGGKFASLKRGPGVHFYWQHDAGWLPNGDVTVFDNGASPPEEKESRGLVLHVDAGAGTVSLIKQFTNPSSTLLASSQGDLLPLPGNNWLMGYGGLPNFTEFDNSGHVLFDATLGTDVQDFRTYLAPWSATPKTVPAVAAQAAGSGTVNVEASWNGATAVASWKVLAGSSASSLTTVASAPKHGFETTIPAHTTGPLIAVAALDASGATLATSAPIKAPS